MASSSCLGRFFGMFLAGVLTLTVLGRLRRKA